eukprot:13382201-Ditylum_brightwellii.AAC.1
MEQKALSEKDREDWPTTQVSFLRAIEKNLTANHDTSSKFRTANSRSEGSKGLTEKEKKLYKDACEKGKRLPANIWRKLTKEEKSELIKLKRGKYNAQNNGGLGFHAYDATESIYKHPVSSQESNQIRAANFLQLVN